MKCYNHHDRDAFGICKVCGKGLCLECMSDKKENGVYCKDSNYCKLFASKFITYAIFILFIIVALKIIF